jgi:hypothetical protein
MSRPRAADDFPVIRERLKELRRERGRALQEPEAGANHASRRLLPPIMRVPIQMGEPRGAGPLKGGRGG